VPWLVELKTFCGDASVVGLRYVANPRRSIFSTLFSRRQHRCSVYVANPRRSIFSTLFSRRQHRCGVCVANPRQSISSTLFARRQHRCGVYVANPRQSIFSTLFVRRQHRCGVYVANPSASSLRRSVWLLLLIAGAAFTAFQIHNRQHSVRICASQVTTLWRYTNAFIIIIIIIIIFTLGSIRSPELKTRS